MKQLFIIPGNPAASHYYDLWIKEFKEKTDYECFYDTFPVLKETNTPEAYLEQMIDFYESRFLSFYNGKEALLIGHSIGGFIASKLLERHPEKFSKVYLIFPFFGDTDFHGKAVLKTAYYVEKSKSLTNFIIKIKNSVKAILPEVSHVTSKELLTSVHFAKYEYLFFNKPSNRKINLPYKEKTTLIYNSKDHWCTKKTREEIKTQIPSFFVDAHHKYIVFKEQREAILEKIIELEKA
jgi:pimeloyl-ACP methyl ester carboxylesterase